MTSEATSVEQQTPSRPTWQQLAIGFVISLVVNVGYILAVHQDQRVLLMLFFTVLIGMLMLLGLETGAYGMGAIVGAAAAVLVVLLMYLLFDWSWFSCDVPSGVRCP
jgi:amino acid permease